MRLAFATGALASALAAAGLVTIAIWVVTVLTGSADAWGVAPALIVGVAFVVAGVTYLAERFVHRRSLERMRSTGEPWAYRDGGR